MDQLILNYLSFVSLKHEPTTYEAARLLTWKAAWEADNGMDNTISASCAKAFATDYGMKTASDALQIFGGYGYTTNFFCKRTIL